MKSEQLVYIINEILEDLGLVDLSEKIDQYLSKRLGEEEFDFYIEEWRKDFDKSDFLRNLGIYGASKLIHFDPYWIEYGSIFSVSCEDHFNADQEMEYRIVINKTNNEKTKAPFINMVLHSTNNREERDLKMGVFRDKLGILGIKLL